MVGAAIGNDLAPSNADDSLDDADGYRSIFEYRSLLDMELQIGGDRTGAVAALTLVADPLQLVAEGGSIAIGPPVDVLRGETAGHGAGGEHCRLEANPLLVRPVDQLQRVSGRDAGVVERPQNLQRGEDAVGAVIAATPAHGVDVGGHDDRGGTHCPGAAPGDVAKVIDANAQPGLLHPAAKEIACGTIFRRKSEPGDAPVRGRSDLGELTQVLVQPFGVDAHVSSLAHPITLNVRVASLRRRPPSAVQTMVSSIRIPNWPGR